MSYAYEDPNKRNKRNKTPWGIIMVGTLVGTLFAFWWLDNPGIIGGMVGGFVGMGVAGVAYRIIRAIRRE